jgi:hypothetical protein
MPARTTISSTAAQARSTAVPRTALGGRPRLALAALAAAAALASSVALISGGDGRDGAPSSPIVNQQTVDERPNIDQIKAAENFHHRR